MKVKDIRDNRSALDESIRSFLQGIACFFFGHSSIGIISEHGELKSRREECIFCKKVLRAEAEYYATEGNLWGYATEILVHKTEHSDTMGVSFVGDGRVFTHIVYTEGDDDVLASACDLANGFEEATGIPWRLHDESRGQFAVEYKS